jgi:hypothetical protein
MLRTRVLLRVLLEGKVVQFGMRLVVSEEEKYEMRRVERSEWDWCLRIPRHCAKNIADSFKNISTYHQLPNLRQL